MPPTRVNIPRSVSCLQAVVRAPHRSGDNGWLSDSSERKSDDNLFFGDETTDGSFSACGFNLFLLLISFLPSSPL